MSGRSPALAKADCEAAMARLAARGITAPTKGELAKESGCHHSFCELYLAKRGTGGGTSAAAAFDGLAAATAAQLDERDTATPGEVLAAMTEGTAPEAATQDGDGATLAGVLAKLRAPHSDGGYAVTREWVRGTVADTLHESRNLLGGRAQGTGGVTIILSDRSSRKLDGELFHAAFERAVLVADATKLLCLYGGTGGGKTHAAAQVARALGLGFTFNSCTAGMPESHIVGRAGVFPRDLGITPREDGTGWRVAYTESGDYIPAPFVTSYEGTDGPALHLLDEWDAADANTRLVVNSGLANGHLAVPGRAGKPVAKRCDQFVCAIGVNTLDGADGGFVARDPLDLASKDRFAMSKVALDYDPTIEAGLVGDALGEFPKLAPVKLLRVRDTLNRSLADVLVGRQGIRAAIAAVGVDNQAMSTRSLQNAAKLTMAGMGTEDVLGVYFTGWATGDRDKVLAAAHLAVVR